MWRVQREIWAAMGIGLGGLVNESKRVKAQVSFDLLTVTSLLSLLRISPSFHFAVLTFQRWNSALLSFAFIPVQQLLLFHSDFTSLFGWLFQPSYFYSSFSISALSSIFISLCLIVCFSFFPSHFCSSFSEHRDMAAQDASGGDGVGAACSGSGRPGMETPTAWLMATEENSSCADWLVSNWFSKPAKEKQDN